MSMSIAITKFFSKYGLGKEVEKGKDGNGLTKIPKFLTSGTFETIECDWSDFGTLLQSLTDKNALAHGVCCKKAAVAGNGEETLKSGKIVTKAQESKLDPGTGCSRTRLNFKYHEPPCPKHNVLMIDIDGLGKGVDIEGATEQLLEYFPALTTLKGGCWAIASAGAMICDRETGETLTGLTGLHVYFALPPGLTVERVEEYMRLQGWVSKTSHWICNEHDYGVSVLERGYIDFAVFQPERLDFIGPSSCGKGLEQRRDEPIWFDTWNEGAGAGSIADAFTVTEAAAEEAIRRRSLEHDAAKEKAAELLGQMLPRLKARGLTVKMLERIGERYELPGLVEIQFDSGEIAPVWKLIFWPEKFAGRYCADPLYPEEGTQKATFYYNKNAERENRFLISSFLRGGQIFKLVTDAEGVREMLKKTDAEEVEKELKTNESWLEELGSLEVSVELPEILEEIKKRHIMTKTELMARIGTEKNAELKSARADLLGLMNERFAYVTIQGKARYIEERPEKSRGEKIVIRSRNDFLAEVEDWAKIEAWGARGPTWKSAGEAWLQWDGRRKYPGGIRFEPGIPEKEFQDPDGGGLVLNRFRGFAVAGIEVEDRICGGHECGGVGCVAWCMQELEAGREGLCPLGFKIDGAETGAGEVDRIGGGNWTYWVRTIHDVACKGVLAHTRWVLDWFADILQAPGGRGRDGKRGEVSLCLRGGQGTGKDSIFEPLHKILGDYAYTVTDMTAITGKFNSFMEDLIFLFANEAIWGGSKKEGNKLKDVVTGAFLSVEHKGINAYKVRNWIRLGIASNSEWVIPAEDDERRYTVFDVSEAHVKDRAWFARVKAGEPGELLADLLGWEIRSNVCVNLDTEALMVQKSFGRDVVEDFLEYAVEENLFWDRDGMGLPVLHRQLEDIFNERYARRRAYVETPESFKRLFRKKLKDKGANLKTKVRTRMGLSNGFLMPPMEWILKAFPWLKTEEDEVEE